MKQIFISSVQKEFERERAAIKRMIESDPILKPHFKAFVFEIDAPAADKTTQQVYLKEIEKSDIYLVLIGNKYGYCDEGCVSPTEQEFDKACCCSDAMCKVRSQVPQSSVCAILGRRSASLASIWNLSRAICSSWRIKPSHSSIDI